MSRTQRWIATADRVAQAIEEALIKAASNAGWLERRCIAAVRHGQAAKRGRSWGAGVETRQGSQSED